jgi:hypothetical protein
MSGSAVSDFSLPARLPYLKHGRCKILERRFEEPLAAGGLDEDKGAELERLTAALGLEPADLQAIRSEHSLREFQPIR